jgi:hypothetical protein
VIASVATSETSRGSRDRDFDERGMRTSLQQGDECGLSVDDAQAGKLRARRRTFQPV